MPINLLLLSRHTSLHELVRVLITKYPSYFVILFETDNYQELDQLKIIQIVKSFDEPLLIENSKCFPVLKILYEGLYFNNENARHTLNSFLHVHLLPGNFDFKENSKGKHNSSQLYLGGNKDKRMTRKIFHPSPERLIDKIVLMKSNKYYRFGDVTYQCGHYWKESIQFILNHPETFKNTILYKYLHNLPSKKHDYCDRYIRIISNYVNQNKTNISLPLDFELVIHIRAGDVVVHDWFLNKNYKKIIQNHVQKYKIRKCTFCIAFHYGDFTEKNLWIFNDKKHNENITKIRKLLGDLMSQFPNLVFDVYSNKNVDHDFVYMIYSNYLVVDKGYFGKLIYDIRRRMSINKQSLLSLNKFQMEKEVLLRNNRIGTHKKILEKISHHPMSLINPKKTYPDQQICFLTYGDHKFARSKQRICNEAKRLGLFDKIIIKSKNDLLVESSEFKKKLKSNPRLQKIFAAPRGGGYWIWKPFVILEQLRKMDENDVLIYTDAGCTVPVGNDGKKQQTKEKLQEYISVVNQSEKGVLAFKNPHIDHVWTTGDIFRYFKTFDDPKVYNTRQFSGGRLHVIRKCNHSMKLYERWWEITHTKPNFYTDNPSSTQNFPRFVENRHDQSVFSILCKVHGVEEEYSWDKIPIKATHIHG